MNTIELLRHFEIELEREHFNRAGDELMALCPFHEEKKPSFSLNVEKGVFYCFGCGEIGNIYQLIEHITELSYEDIRKAIGDDETPEYTPKDLPKKELKTLSNAEIDALTLYAQTSHRLLKGEACIDPTDESVTIYTDYLKQRGISMEAAAYFQLGANRYSFINLNRPRRHQVWLHDAIEQDHPQGAEMVDNLKALNLVNKRGSDYWFRPAILIPYQYQGEVYWMNARHIPPHDDEIKYMGMRGIKRAHLFNEDALGEFEEVFVVESEMNAILMWDRGCKGVVSFGSKHSLTDELIERLWGKHVILYMDTDKNDPEHHTRAKAMGKIQQVAKSVVYFEMKEGEDPASYLRNHSWHQFEEEIIPEFQYPDEPTDWQPHEIRPRLDQPIVISLKEAQEKNQELFENLSVNLPAYSGQVILCNMAVGTIKTTSAIEGVNRAHVPSLVAVGQHNLANEYETRLDVPSLLHLYGRAHPNVGCEYHRLAMKLCNAGWSYYFKRNICVGKCSKSVTCIHFNQQEKARVSHTLLVTHAHVQLFDFLTNPYYGNDTRRFVIVDEMPELVREIVFTQKDIQDNIDILTTLKGRVSMGQSLFLESNECLDAYITVFEQMNEASQNRKDYSAGDRRFHPRELKAVLKSVRPNVGQDPLPTIANKAKRRLVPVSARDLEKDIEFLRVDVPVIHHGMLGTNLFSDIEVLIVLNAHYYNPYAIIAGVKTQFGIDLNLKCFRKRQTTFKTLDEEYTVSRWGYFDKEQPDNTEMVETFLENNQRADMIQAEGRVLRGEDVPRWIYRLHNVNIPPFPNTVYRSWTTFLKNEFGYINPKTIKGNVKKALEWIEQNASDREFTVTELTEALGGYLHLWKYTLNRLSELGLIELSEVSKGQHDANKWKLTKG